MATGAIYNPPTREEHNALKSEIDEISNVVTEIPLTITPSFAYIVGDTNTTGAALSIGQFVYVKGHATIAEGLRTVTAGIASDGSITTNNTDACPEGGLNALNSRRPKSGYKNITIPAGGSQAETVLFDTAYPAGTSYSVQITQADQYAYADLYFGSTDRSVNGFKLTGSSNRSASITLQVMWAAIPI